MSNFKITDQQITDGVNKAYKKAGANAYFGNGFNYGVSFTEDHYSELLEQRNELLDCLSGLLDDFRYYISEQEEQPQRAGYIVESEKLLKKCDPSEQ